MQWKPEDLDTMVKVYAFLFYVFGFFAAILLTYLSGWAIVGLIKLYKYIKTQKKFRYRHNIKVS